MPLNTAFVTGRFQFLPTVEGWRGVIWRSPVAEIIPVKGQAFLSDVTPSKCSQIVLTRHALYGLSHLLSPEIFLRRLKGEGRAGAEW